VTGDFEQVGVRVEPPIEDALLPFHATAYPRCQDRSDNGPEQSPHDADDRDDHATSPSE
jgi:hypothetical protein